MVRSYRDLEAWQKAIEYTELIYRATQAFPSDERFGLTNQLRRSAVSVASNIAEGQGRATTKEYLHFLHVASGSLQENETQVIIAHRLEFISTSQHRELESLSATVGKLISGLIRSLKSRIG